MDNQNIDTMDWTVLYLFTQVKSAVYVAKIMGAPPEEVWKACYSGILRAQSSVDNPNNTLAVPQATRDLIKELMFCLFPDGDTCTWQQKVMMLEATVNREIELCIGGKCIFPQNLTEEMMIVLGFYSKNRNGLYQVPFYLIDFVPRDVLVFTSDGSATTTLEEQLPNLESPDPNGMSNISVYAPSKLPKSFSHLFGASNL